MTTSMDAAQTDLWDAAAGEYVLGLLPEDERAMFEVRLASDVQLEQDVAAWSLYFSGFAEEIEDVVPPPQIKRRIESELFPGPPKNVLLTVLPYLLGAVLSGLAAWIAVEAGLLELL
ncbi:hypothetical protein [Thalassococcus lentus]|uniref:Anti-sigma factor n=1 Tax=Thalassococcus lentus TaxID=1210524 RepID=A0ABT4XVC2_9RHOB|nr:hypothetical protein [Thalassococcus lentus]MDA7425758.1 hypothetical protein [Thalassococcus lentus]